MRHTFEVAVGEIAPEQRSTGPAGATRLFDIVHVPPGFVKMNYPNVTTVVRYATLTFPHFFG